MSLQWNSGIRQCREELKKRKGCVYDEEAAASASKSEGVWRRAGVKALKVR